jgi:hypothetical protein
MRQQIQNIEESFISLYICIILTTNNVSDYMYMYIKNTVGVQYWWHSKIDIYLFIVWHLVYISDRNRTVSNIESSIFIYRYKYMYIYLLDRTLFHYKRCDLNKGGAAEYYKSDKIYPISHIYHWQHIMFW